MPSTTFTLSIQKEPHGYWHAFLSDGIQEAYIYASSIPSEPLLPLVWAVRSLLLGATEATCSWWAEPGEYRWHLSRHDEQLLIHILWFNHTRPHSQDHGETFLHIQCNLLQFAKRLSHQLSQIAYQEGVPAIDPQDHQKLKDTIHTFSRRLTREQLFTTADEKPPA